LISTLKATWSSDRGKLLLHFSRIALLLDDSTPPATPTDWEPPLTPLPIPLPERLQRSRADQHYFTLEAEVRNLQDLYLVHLGFQGVVQKLKERDEVHDFDDIQRLAGDLLLANCPTACRTFYHPSIQRALDSLADSPWRDDHIEAAFTALAALESDPSRAGDSAAHLGAIRADLKSRFDLLRRIRRRYRAFIIDEAQDNSPLQWRLLSRLWGERLNEEGDPRTPDTPWQPTVCYVGDVKQSIYAFRQAEVTGFLEFANYLRKVNSHEFASVPELTRKPALRSDTHSRDPRNAHAITIATASEHMEKGGRDLVAWIPFDATDRNLPAPGGVEVEARREGLISLQVNYRTEGGLLRAMNEWWDDVFC
ncbi:MAG: UvrD-helicase domain-containing protein, partial [Candidatus Thalassarchaeum sp.]|nr:UvrD-helicase domain-containing protein [Candidatus Thalassarchaeum sp.]